MLIFLVFLTVICGLPQIVQLQNATTHAQADTMKSTRSAIDTMKWDAVNVGLEYTQAKVPDDLMNKALGLPIFGIL